MRRLAVTLGLGGVVLGLVVWGWTQTVTWPRDVTGVPAPICTYEDPTGQILKCTQATPLPIQQIGTPTQTVGSTTRGFGKVWEQVQGISTAGTGTRIPVSVGNNDVVVIASKTGTTDITIYRTPYQGINWSALGTASVTLTTNAEDQIRGAVFVPADQRLIVARGDSEGSVAGVYGTSDLLTWSLIVNWCCPAAPSAQINRILGGPVLQGNTMLVVGRGRVQGGAAGDIQDIVIARSTDRGATWTLSASATGMPRCESTNNEVCRAGARLASPSASVWLVGVSTGTSATPPLELWRSVDDGVTWTRVLSGAALQDSTPPALICLDASTCLASNGAGATQTGTIYRSTTAGATWTTAASLVGCCNGFVSFGRGVVAAIGQLDGTPPTSTWYVSADSGLTWAPAQARLLAGGTVASGAIGVAGLTPGTAVVGSPQRVTTTPARTWISRPTLANEPVGHLGVPFAQQSDGSLSAALVAQLDDISPAACPEQAICLARLTAQRALHTNLRTETGSEFGTATAPVRVDPTGTTTQPVSGTVTAAQGTAAAGTSAWPIAPIQGATLFNSRSVSAANTAVTVTIAAAVGQRAHLYGLDASCSAGTAQVTVDDGATRIWETLAAEIGTSRLRVTWPVGLTGSTNTAMTITLSACGAGNTGTLIVQADRF